MTSVMLIILAVWFVALFSGAPIYVLMGLAGAAFAYVTDINLIVIPQKFTKAADSFPLLAAPMYILMGSLMNSSGVTERIFRFATVCVGWWKGGLCHANILGSVIFAGMSGSAVADAGGIGVIEIKAMRDAGYDGETAAAITAASATIGPIIPPSLPMIIYGVSAETSIGNLFLGGVIPGLLMAAALMVMVRALAIRKNLPSAPIPGRQEIWGAFVGAFPALMCPVVLFGGMMTGFFTPTESAGVAAFYALLVGFYYRDIDIRQIPRIVLETVETTGVLMALVMSASLLGYALSMSRLPQEFGGWLTGTVSSQIAYLLMVNVLLLIVGCFMEAISAMLILIPILVPPAMALGIDPTQFGLVVVLNLMIGTITPPVGIVLFITARVADLPFDKVCKASLPFLWPLVSVLVAITFVPSLTTWLPAVFK
ncbi:TRAP transporter large permease [uncultured Propionivibrio sp.]|uniref:TRAP transporter large permease n=1 Tax=uncultured Propionivibrio sp. TaxID=426737 RepID=UPI0029C0931C|nr:TRAP transporter large permease [uncultured Propionivibrio sp.]